MNDLSFALRHPGFNPANATVLRLSLPEKNMRKTEQQVAFADTLLKRLRTLPGVKSLGLTHTLPLLGDCVLGFSAAVGSRKPTSATNFGMELKLTLENRKSAMLPAVGLPRGFHNAITLGGREPERQTIRPFAPGPRPKPTFAVPKSEISHE